MNDWYRPKKAFAKRAVAYYRHSAQERQENSVEIQQDQVRKFAADNGVEIIEEFIDRGKTGLIMEGRDAFKRMLSGIETGKIDCDYVLVLDVSRWGRFQDTDIAAYYTSLCAMHGKPVIYASIGFPPESDLIHTLRINIERYQAANYRGRPRRGEVHSWRVDRSGVSARQRCRLPRRYLRRRHRREGAAPPSPPAILRAWGAATEVGRRWSSGVAAGQRCRLPRRYLRRRPRLRVSLPERSFCEAVERSDHTRDCASRFAGGEPNNLNSVQR
jgi:hypothetical protein